MTGGRVGAEGTAASRPGRVAPGAADPVGASAGCSPARGGRPDPMDAGMLHLLQGSSQLRPPLRLCVRRQKPQKPKKTNKIRPAGTPCVPPVQAGAAGVVVSLKLCPCHILQLPPCSISHKHALCKRNQGVHKDWAPTRRGRAVNCHANAATESC